MDAMTMDATQVLADLSAQVDWYGKLLRLAELQHTLVEQERVDDLLVVLNKRQTIVDALTAIEQRLRPVKRAWNELSAAVDAPTRSDIESKFAAARDLLARITQADADDTLLLTQRKLNVAQQLKQTNTGRQVNQNYAANAYARQGGRLNVAT